MTWAMEDGAATNVEGAMEYSGSTIVACAPGSTVLCPPWGASEAPPGQAARHDELYVDNKHLEGASSSSTRTWLKELTSFTAPLKTVGLLEDTERRMRVEHPLHVFPSRELVSTTDGLQSDAPWHKKKGGNQACNHPWLHSPSVFSVAQDELPPEQQQTSPSFFPGDIPSCRPG